MKFEYKKSLLKLRDIKSPLVIGTLQVGLTSMDDPVHFVQKVSSDHFIVKGEEEEKNPPRKERSQGQLVKNINHSTFPK